jgi:hypothetical protein
MSRKAPKKVAIVLVLAAVYTTALGVQTPRRKENAAQNSRIQALLVYLADEARASDDLAFSVRAQSQAAELLWSRDADRARQIFRRAYDSLAAADGERSDGQARRNPVIPIAARLQIRAELLNQIAARDPELVEELARKLSVTGEPPKEAVSSAADAVPSSGPARLDTTQRELFVSLALQIVERDPHRAMTLGQLSLGMLSERSASISPNFTRLLVLMRGVDQSLARLLFSAAVDRLEQSPSPALADIQAMSSYLASSDRDSAGKSETQRFLKLAFNRIMHYRERAAFEAAPLALDRTPRLDDKSAIYFIGRQLADFFVRYQPDRLPQLRRRVAELTDSTTAEQPDDSLSLEAVGPVDIVRQARQTPEGSDRDALYARAALSWLAQGEADEAQAAALKIIGPKTRDRVLAQVARRIIAEGPLEDAVAVARKIEDRSLKVSLLVRAATASLDCRNRVRAGELLNEAENVALKAAASLERAQALLAVVDSFASFDTIRAFEVMQSAVKSINQLLSAPEETRPGTASEQLGNGDFYHLGLEETLASLARADFEGALLLARQLDSRDASVIAQLAVCGGGLSAESKPESTGEDAGAGLNPH